MLNITGVMDHMSSEMNIMALMTILSLIPIVVISMTTFTRNVIVFSFLRYALGLQQSPPNIVIIVLSLVITAFTMNPIFKKMYDMGVLPYIQNESTFSESIQNSWQPMRNFLILQTQEKDISFIYKMAKADLPSSIDNIEVQYLVPAFMLSELKLAFKIGFIIFLPFLLVDLIVAAMLTALGMIMLPPVTISLPIKIMLFVVIDGWELITQVLISGVVT